MSEMQAAQVTIGDLYRELVGMRGDLTRSLSKLEVMESRHGDAERILADHESRRRTAEAALPTGLEGRIMSLERFRWQVVGALIVINALALAVEYFLTAHK